MKASSSLPTATPPPRTTPAPPSSSICPRHTIPKFCAANKLLPARLLRGSLSLSLSLFILSLSLFPAFYDETGTLESRGTLKSHAYKDIRVPSHLSRPPDTNKSSKRDKSAMTQPRKMVLVSKDSAKKLATSLGKPFGLVHCERCYGQDNHTCWPISVLMYVLIFVHNIVENDTIYGFVQILWPHAFLRREGLRKAFFEASERALPSRISRFQRNGFLAR